MPYKEKQFEYTNAKSRCAKKCIYRLKNNQALSIRIYVV